MDECCLNKSTLLEEVFSEVESLENSTRKELNFIKPSGFLDDILSLEKKKSNKEEEEEKKRNENESDHKKILQEVKSMIHEGLTDSSDDEDNKYFEERKYSDCGKNFKNLIKQKTVSNDYSRESASVIQDTWKNSQTARQTLKKQLEELSQCSTNKDVLLDPVLGMRIKNPLISSTMLREKMIGRVAISTEKVKKFVDSSAFKDSDWVTGGAIVSKITRTSQKGNQYCVWNISDLSGDIKTVCVFLFGSAYKEYWKLSISTVVGILNPEVMEGKDKSEVTLKISNPQKILVMGTSKDYGICKSKKKNGENCSSVVNIARCDYCTYHMKKEYNKACRRSDLQPPKIGRSLDNLRAKVLGKSQVFYGGKTFTAVVGKKGAKQVQKDEQRLKKLSERISGSRSQAQEDKDKAILNRINGNLQTSSPKIGQPSTPNQNTICLNFTISEKDRSAAKANALKYIRQHGPLKKPPDSERVKRTPEQIVFLKRKLELKENENRKKIKKNESDNDEVNPLKEKLKKHGITDEFLKLMNVESRNTDLLKLAETEEREKYFNKLEVREKIEDKMASTFKVECKAVRCLKCNYKSFSASDLCKKEKHPLKVFNAIKRFWKCKNCSARTVCLELVPLHACKTCGSSKWERASMMPEKKGPNLTVEPLSLRGHEEKFIGAVVKNANLNLLVPEETS